LNHSKNIFKESESQMKAIISVANVAARVGKTTISISLAVEMASRGFRTLLIDADPQAQTTSFFMSNDQIVWTLADTLCPPSAGTRHHFARLDLFGPSRFANLNIVPSSIRLATFESLEFSHITDLKARLATIERNYEFIIIDTPSSLALLTQSCLYASTHVLAIVSPGGQSTAGLQLLSDFLGDMPCATRPTLLGIVCNRFDCRRRESGMFYETLSNDWGALLCETIIHRDDLIVSCGERHQVIQPLVPTSPAASLYSDLTEEFIIRLETLGTHFKSTPSSSIALFNN
jgi:chromosome partitioning protein